MPSKVRELYWQAVEDISLCQDMVRESVRKNAAMLMGLLSHYYAGITMPIHTDDTSDDSPEHTETTLIFPDGSTKKDSYHPLYEKAADWGVKVTAKDNLTNVVYELTYDYHPWYIEAVESFVLETAMFSNGYPAETIATDPDVLL